MTINQYHFETISEYHKFMGLPEPEHPLFSVITANDTDVTRALDSSGEMLRLSQNFYSISIKRVIQGVIHYGRTRYDCDKGVMLFFAPNQEVVIEGVVVSDKSSLILIHDDYIKGHDIRNHIKKSGFFSYQVNEALHLSPREENQMRHIFENISQEYHNNQDEFSKDLILSQLDTLLKYANRYYKRQFINRKEMSGNTAEQFNNILSDYFETGQFADNGIPSIEDMAREMRLSHRYLSDALKAETGKSALQHIHLYLIEEAKNMLLQSDLTIENVSSQLGFDYPHYFSRLFKKKVGKSPSEFRSEFTRH